ncbi:MAG: CDP-diacylglycerol--glycerol-3-phosphate 3-phosphatidyltransferase [Clostridia bacterium]|nr:CDP-diacylglycerol--glycerol-3-phosphate 3-phosphatidyltransferase [Clostridia bacterium]
MNLPNKLTLVRCILTPIFMACLIIDFPLHYGVALLVFVAASLTDYFDGKIARRRNLVTNLGKFLDPLADKALTTAAFIGFVHMLNSRSLPWALFIILAREFAVTSVRLLAAKDGVVVAASFAGKLKTVMQMVSIIYMLAFRQAVRFAAVRGFLGDAGIRWGSHIGMAFIWISVIATVVSGIQYIWELRHYFKEEK